MHCTKEIISQAIKKTILSAALGICILTAVPVQSAGNHLVLIQETQAAKLPKATATATKKNVSTLLKKYDAGAYHIVKTQGVETFWFTGRSLIEGIGTCVHETFHLYSSTQGGYNMKQNCFYEKFYVGKKSYKINRYRDVMKTSEFSKTIPFNLRTFRYSTYVSAGSYADSNQSGMAGLLNEFAAYYWGLRTMDSLRPYVLDQNSDEAWMAYIESLGNDMTAYAEFKYWMLGYMNYAKKHDPATYKKVINDKQFCKAYADIEKKFAKLIKDNQKKLSSCNPNIRIADNYVSYRNGENATEVGLGDYLRLTNEMKKSKYVKMDKLLKSKAK